MMPPLPRMGTLTDTSGHAPTISQISKLDSVTKNVTAGTKLLDHFVRKALKIMDEVLVSHKRLLKIRMFNKVVVFKTNYILYLPYKI
jgi:hypothetical protein